MLSTIKSLNSGTLLMGVLNVTPDSFSDGNEYVAVETALERGMQMVREGAQIVDVGGESTRPGAALVGAAEEQMRALPVVEALNNAGITVSIDTINADTAAKAVKLGAKIVNDVSGGTFDSAMYATVAKLAQSHGVAYMIGHWQGIPDPAHQKTTYDDVVAEVIADLRRQTAAAVAAGVPAENIIIDPGLGFDKDSADSWQLLQQAARLQSLGFPLCVGVSRKRMMGDILKATGTSSTDFKDRDLATAVTTALAARAGIEIVRVHDVQGSAQALEVVRQWGEATPFIKKAGEDKITLTGLEVFAHHGVFDFERKNGQKFLLDIEVLTDMTPAINGDALAETVHYGELAERVKEAVESDPVDLIETVADRVANVALSFKAARQVTVTVHKPEAPIPATFADVSVTITRTKGAGAKK